LQKLKEKKKYKCKCIKNKSDLINPLHTFFMTLFSRAGTSTVLEFCIGDLRPVFPMENSYLYIGNKWKETNLMIRTPSM